MILNISQIKTEALLLFCQDIINTYKDTDENIFDIDNNTIEYIKKTSITISKQIQRALKPRNYYLTNTHRPQARAVIMTYEYIHKELGKYLQKNTPFNPAMLCFSMLATWFKELNYESKSKKYIYFSLFVYADIYDALFLRQSNEEFKQLNKKMIDIAEKVTVTLHETKIF